MPKKKSSTSDNNQPELPLGNGAEAPMPAPAAAKAKAVESAVPKGPAPANGDSGSEPPEGAVVVPPSLVPGDAPPPPARRGGDSVQTEDSPLANSYRHWFLEYASYVILDRAVPHIDDGLKPVQRRILHTLWEMDDGRFHKVANVVGRTMSLHPHGDASIGAALVAIGQRAFLIEPLGNYGNTLTGAAAAAPRYIEARLTNFAKDVLFNPKTTTWQLSYDGRAREPVTLPAKFPVVLLDGAEGIAVGLATKILPHNFNDLCRAAINHLQGKSFRIYPDFPSGGIADFSEYNDGERGGKVKIRAKIEQRSKYLLAITELPFGTTTETLIESILAANAKGKIKVKHVDDNTADQVEILVHLPQGSDPEQVRQQLYVFTGCQQNLSPAACVIVHDATTGADKPEFLGAREILKRSVDQTRALLNRELEIKLGELDQQWHWDSLERIFIEERIYRRIEKSKTWENVLEEIREGLKPFLKQLRRAVTDDDLARLTEIRIKRISAFNRFQADEAIRKIEEGIKETKVNLKNLTAYAIAWFEMLQEKYGKGLKRRTSYDEI
jgi:topoisomerase-4 subunit A